MALSALGACVRQVGVEDSQPINSSIVVVDETQLTVSWFTPVYLGGEPILGYKVEWYVCPPVAKLFTHTCLCILPPCWACLSPPPPPYY